ncbi:MAG TPA: hypothetical protein VGF16_09035 [Bryobacteraceae bacterium]|jgi:hypothetical protein
MKRAWTGYGPGIERVSGISYSRTAPSFPITIVQPAGQSYRLKDKRRPAVTARPILTRST